MIRAEAFRQVGGFNPSIIAAEDDDSACGCAKRVDDPPDRRGDDPSRHGDDRFRQWWRRSVRTGHAYAEGSADVRPDPRTAFRPGDAEHHLLGDRCPAPGLGLAWPTRGISLAVLGGYLFLYRRICRYYALHRGWPQADARLYAAWIVLAKFPQAVGVVRYWLGRLLGERSPVIEHRDLVRPRVRYRDERA